LCYDEREAPERVKYEIRILRSAEKEMEKLLIAIHSRIKCIV